MKSFVFGLVFFVIISMTAYSETNWTGGLYFTRYQGTQYSYYATYYDQNVKSMVLVIGYLYANPNTTQFILIENENPKLYSKVDNLLQQCLNAVNQASTGNTAYYYFQLYYAGPGLTVGTNKILGISLASKL